MEKRADKYPGVAKVTDAERIEMVKEIFSTITGKYDFLNHFLSLRRDIAWRRFTAGKMRFFNTYRMLDVATGTADLAIDVARRHPNARITGLDFVKEMIDLGGAKIQVKLLSDRVRMLRGDALCLPFADNCFDVAAIAFGIRNIPDKIAAIKEMMRIVAPGGQVMILEMTFPQNGPFQKLYNVYLNRILPYVARTFTANPGAYHYLADSIMHFPSPEALAGLMEKAGLTNVEKHSLTLGITHLHVGVKPEVQ
ncbi:MAG: bifunctional demethylmenaquinone methyltransferase/2-methoxy-6-polyprenyl-1,4-benzoquinol methylase UbiE [Desulfobacterales bacterium]|nr:bifunctional demethylmenaquinone methyltransferase/2-methoxy-6-polyprenyl-1,4-benzoquinol methylase UbiE [Desulfobacterales bacterium]